MNSNASKSPLEVFNLRGPILLKPLEAKDSHPYFLSNVDLALAPTISAVFIFDAATELKDSPTYIMRDALQKVLTQYYALAGRLRRSPQGKVFVECNGKGVYFVEADANIDISKLKELGLPDPTKLDDLVFPIPAVGDTPLLTAMVTKFKCGGFVLGLVFLHCMLDGAALGEFLNAWGDATRGLPLLMPPFIGRSILQARMPLQIEHPHTEFVQVGDISASSRSFKDTLVNKSFCFSPMSLEKLKKKAMEDGTVSKCTTFEALAALLWKVRTQAMTMRAEQKVKLVMVVNRKLGVEAGLPKGYMGNAFEFTYAVASAREIEEQPLSNIVKHVQSAKARASQGYLLSQIDHMECNKMKVLPVQGSFVINDWSKSSFYDTNFTSGMPIDLPVTPVRDMAVFVRHGQDINVLMALPHKIAQKMEDLLLPQWILSRL